MGLTIFDLDRTLFKGNSSVQYYFFLCLKKVVPFSSLGEACFFYLQFLLGKLSPIEFHEKIFYKFLKGKKATLFRTFSSIFWKECSLRKFYLPALLHLKKAQEKKDDLLLLSNSPDFLVEPIAEMLHIDEFYASQYEEDPFQNFMKIAILMEGREKVRQAHKVAARLKISLKEITVYSDSIWDLPLLEMAGVPIVVCPDRRLRKISRKRGWEIL